MNLNIVLIRDHIITFKGKKDEKVRVVRAHIGSKILTSIMRDSHNNIQPASDSNSESARASGRVEHIVGSSSNSSELNDSGDTDSQREQEAEERYLILALRLDTAGEEHESYEKT